MKILFLDVDGVLNCRKTPQLITDLYPLDPYMVLLVDRIIQATDCKVVLSSSWRNHPDGEKAIAKVIPLFDKTPDLPGVIGAYAVGTKHCHRGKEIKAWLDEAKEWEVKKYAILDDNQDFLPEQQDNFFKTTWEFGITEEIANKVIEHLNK